MKVIELTIFSPNGTKKEHFDKRRGIYLELELEVNMVCMFVSRGQSILSTDWSGPIQMI